MPKTKEINFLVTTKNTQSISIKRSWKELSFQVMKTFYDAGIAYNDFIVQKNGLIERLQIRYTHETNCKKLFY